MFLARIISGLLRLAIALALAGELKACTLELLGRAAEKTEVGVMSYSRFTRMLLGQPAREKTRDRDARAARDRDATHGHEAETR